MKTHIFSLFLSLALLMSAAAKAQATDPIVTLRDGRTLRSSLLLARKETHDWIVFLPGSGSSYKVTTDPGYISLIGGLKYRANFLIMGKPGVYPTRTSGRRFEASFRRATRIEDDLEVLKTLIPESDNIYLVGYSEGGYLAPELAVKDERVKAVALLAGGTRGWLVEEVNKLRGHERREMQRLADEMIANPDPSKVWNDMSWATWASYSGNETLESLEQARVPTLAIHGDKDDLIDVKTAISDIRRLIREGKPLKSKIIRGAGHGFDTQWPEVNSAIQGFLRKQMDFNECLVKTAS